MGRTPLRHVLIPLTLSKSMFERNFTQRQDTRLRITDDRNQTIFRIGNGSQLTRRCQRFPGSIFRKQDTRARFRTIQNGGDQTVTQRQGKANSSHGKVFGSISPEAMNAREYINRTVSCLRSLYRETSSRRPSVETDPHLTAA